MLAYTLYKKRCRQLCTGLENKLSFPALHDNSGLRGYTMPEKAELILLTRKMFKISGLSCSWEDFHIYCRICISHCRQLCFSSEHQIALLNGRRSACVHRIYSSRHRTICKNGGTCFWANHSLRHFFLLFIYITLQMSSAFAGIRGKVRQWYGQELSDPVNNGVGIIFQFLLLSGLMIASVIFAKSLSESTAKMAMGLRRKERGLRAKIRLVFWEWARRSWFSPWQKVDIRNGIVCLASQAQAFAIEATTSDVFPEQVVSASPNWTP